jgi:hypothetical protein
MTDREETAKITIERDFLLLELDGVEISNRCFHATACQHSYCHSIRITKRLHPTFVVPNGKSLKPEIAGRLSLSDLSSIAESVSHRNQLRPFPSNPKLHSIP